MSESSDISNFESTIDDVDDEKSIVSSSTSESDENDEILDSIKVSPFGNKSSQRKTKDDSTKKIRYIYPPAPGEKDERISPRIMSVFEYAALIGERAEMISKGAKIHPKYASYETYDLEKIARLELDDSSIPFPLMIRRPIDNPTHPTIVEIFKVREFLTPNQSLVNHIERYVPFNNWKVFE